MAAPRKAITLSAIRVGEDLTKREALKAFSLASIQLLSGSDLERLKGILRHGEEPGVWVTPLDWAPSLSVARHSLNLRELIVARLPQAFQPILSPGVRSIQLEKLLREAVLSFTRYLLLLRMGPAGGRKKRNAPLATSTIIHRADSYIADMYAAAIAQALTTNRWQSISAQSAPETSRILGLLSLASLQFSESKTRHIEWEALRMMKFSDLHLWSDVPKDESPTVADAMTSPPAFSFNLGKTRDPHRPFPDEFIAALGQRSIWLIEDMAPNVFAIASKVKVICRATRTGKLTEDDCRKAVQQVLSEHVWVDGKGTPFLRPLYAVLLPGDRVPRKSKKTSRASNRATVAQSPTSMNGLESQAEARWPPKSHRDFLALAGVVQMAHYFPLALLFSSRTVEMKQMRRDCIERSRDGRKYANGRTYKFSGRNEGKERDWQLPSFAEAVLEQQVRLISAIEPVCKLSPSFPMVESGPSGYLWGQVSAGAGSFANKPVDGSRMLKSFAQSLGLELYPGGQAIRHHRCRKTIARLVALAIVEAPKLLQELFGHESMEDTLYYILQDEALGVDIDTVARELRVMLAKQAIEDMVEAETSVIDESRLYAGYGGLGAISLDNAITSHCESRHRRGEMWGETSSVELAKILTQQGQYWELVRKGVICTKLPGQTGPCNKRKGRPEPSNCSSGCDHRLEQKFLHDDVDCCIQESVENYEAATIQGDLSQVALWASQISAHVRRFPDLQAKWAEHKTVKEVMNAGLGMPA
jgi:hypothetical protein